MSGPVSSLYTSLLSVQKEEIERLVDNREPHFPLSARLLISGASMMEGIGTVFFRYSDLLPIYPLANYSSGSDAKALTETAPYRTRSCVWGKAGPRVLNAGYLAYTYPQP